MNTTDISFPNLGIYLKNVPCKFNLFGKFEVAMYGITFAIGVVLGIMVASKLAKEEGQDEDTFWSFALAEIILSLVGARIYYIIFSWWRFKTPFEEGKIWEGIVGLINLRRGGIAIYGAVIAAFIVLYFFCKRKKVNPFIYGDMAIPALILGQAIGRWGNFFNREVFGEYTDSLFAMRLPVSEYVREEDISALQKLNMQVSETGVRYFQAHPTFLYESVWNFGVFAILMLYRKHKKFNGELCLLYFAGYGIGRFWIEGIRTDQLKMIGTSIPVSQVVAIVLIVIAIAGEIAARVAIAKGKLPKLLQVRTAEEKAADAERIKKEAEEKKAKKEAKSERIEYVIEASEPDDEEDDVKHPTSDESDDEKETK